MDSVSLRPSMRGEERTSVFIVMQSGDLEMILSRGSE